MQKGKAAASPPAMVLQGRPPQQNPRGPPTSQQRPDDFNPRQAQTFQMAGQMPPNIVMQQMTGQMPNPQGQPRLPNQQQFYHNQRPIRIPQRHQPPTSQPMYSSPPGGAVVQMMGPPGPVQFIPSGQPGPFMPQPVDFSQIPMGGPPQVPYRPQQPMQGQFPQVSGPSQPQGPYGGGYQPSPVYQMGQPSPGPVYIIRAPGPAPPMPGMQQYQPPTFEPRREKKIIQIKDPNSNKDVTPEILNRQPSGNLTGSTGRTPYNTTPDISGQSSSSSSSPNNTTPDSSGQSSRSSTPPLTSQQQAEANVRAQFAAQVAATLANNTEEKRRKPEFAIQKAPVNNTTPDISGQSSRSSTPPLTSQQQVVPPEINLRGHLALEAYNRALNEGKTYVKRVPVMLVGQDRSGKTSLKKSLTGKLFNPDEDSTVGIDIDPSYFKVSTEVWKTGQKDQVANAEAAISFEHHTARLVVENLKQENFVPAERVVEHVQSGGFIQVDTISSRRSDDGNHVSDSDSSQREERVTTFAPPEIPDEIEALIKKLLQEVDKLTEEEVVYSVLWDFGGQSVYYVTHPLFLTGRAMFLLVYDLSRDPHEIAKPDVKQGMFKKIEDSFGTKTNLDYLDFWMTSIASLASQDEYHPVYASTKFNVLPEKLPPVFLVCTHADEPYGGGDPCVLAREVYGSLQTKPYKSQLCEDAFVVDNTKSGGESECSEIARLRQKVLTAAKELPQMNEVIPIKWLKYEKVLQIAKKEGHKWLSLEGAKQIASEVCKIDDNQEFLTLLNFLHDQRILIHFDDAPVLNNLVVLDPQWLIDVFKKVITIPPYDHKEREFKELWLKLETAGILMEPLLEHVWGPLLYQQETFQGLVAIMEKFSLLCPWPSSDASCGKQYLVPSMLMSHPPQDIINLVASAEFPSLFLKFETGQVLVGLFPRLVVQFVQWAVHDEFWSSMNPHLYHNFARFYVAGDEECSVLLLCHPSSIEVVVHRGNLGSELADSLLSKLNIFARARYDAFKVACARAVQRQLGLMLESMRKEFFWLRNMRYEMGVICPVCCPGGAVKYCRTHHKQGCKGEECLHFLTESELHNTKQFIICTRSATALRNKVDVKQFEPWFATLCEQLATGERDGRLLPSDEGIGDKSLALPDKVVESLLSQSCDPKEVVLQLKQSLQLDQSSLEQPEPGTKRLIRCLAAKAKQLNRLDVVKHLREITPAGTTGPLLPDHLDIRNIPVCQMRDLTIDLSGGDEWKEVAEKLGLTPKEIRYLDKRILNPCDAVLAFIAQQCHISVAYLYDVLNKCELPVLADLL